jgi:hypothetical protein
VPHRAPLEKIVDEHLPIFAVYFHDQRLQALFWLIVEHLRWGRAAAPAAGADKLTRK